MDEVADLQTVLIETQGHAFHPHKASFGKQRDEKEGEEGEEAHDPSLRKEGQAKVIHLPNEEIHQGKSQEHEGNGADEAREERERTINLMEEVGETQRKRVILHLESRGFLLPA